MRHGLPVWDITKCILFWTETSKKQEGSSCQLANIVNILVGKPIFAYLKKVSEVSELN